MADEFDRAQDLEATEREMLLQGHATRPRVAASTECADCGVDLEAHRVEFGLCFECATAREKRAAQIRRH